MKQYLTLLLPIFIYLFNSCTPCSVKKIPCEAFNEPAFFKWFPYHQNQRLLFRNTLTSDTFSYVISQLDTSGAYEESRGGFNNTAHACNASAYISTVNDGSLDRFFSIYYSVSKEFDNGPVNKYLSMYFNSAYWPAGEIDETGMAASTENADSVTIATAGNVTFDDGINYPYIVTLTKDTLLNKVDRVYKLFIGKNSGIIGFEMFPSRQKWIIQ